MTVTSINATGIVTYWTTTPTSLKKLRKACEAIMPNIAKMIPDASAPIGALRQAIEGVFPTMLVRRLAGDTGFAIVREDRGSTENTYEPIGSVWFEKDDSISMTGISSDDSAAIRAGYESHREILRPAQVGHFLGRVISEFIQGTSLRPTGGVYWMDEGSLSTWQAVAEAVETSSIAGGSAVYMIRHNMDAESIRAVRDAIIAEVSGEAVRLESEITAGALGLVGIGNREKQAIELMKKVERYEGLLATGLTDLRKSLDKVKDAAAAASVLASVVTE